MTRKTKPRMDWFEYKCQQCGHEWKTLIANPAICKSCKSYKWTQKPGSKREG